MGPQQQQQQQQQMKVHSVASGAVLVGGLQCCCALLSLLKRRWPADVLFGSSMGTGASCRAYVEHSKALCCKVFNRCPTARTSTHTWC
jgi:hypothetical protein